MINMANVENVNTILIPGYKKNKTTSIKNC